MKQYITKESPERVDLATSDSVQYITRHVQLSLRHVDSRGSMRLMTLKFGILKGLRFDMVIGLYAISFHFMEVIQDLLTLQLEYLESKNSELAMLYGQHQQLFLAMMWSQSSQSTSALKIVNTGQNRASRLQLGAYSPVTCSETPGLITNNR